MTEEQRRKAIAACERIEAANARLQAIAKEALAKLPLMTSPICLDCGVDTSFQDHADECSTKR